MGYFKDEWGEKALRGAYAIKTLHRWSNIWHNQGKFDQEVWDALYALYGIVFHILYQKGSEDCSWEYWARKAMDVILGDKDTIAEVMQFRKNLYKEVPYTTK